MPMLIEAARLLEEGVAGKEEIDLLVKKGVGFPTGPFELGDLIGLDVGLDVISYLHEELGEPYYAPPRVPKTMVRAAAGLAARPAWVSTSTRKSDREEPSGKTGRQGGTGDGGGARHRAGHRDALRPGGRAGVPDRRGA